MTLITVNIIAAFIAGFAIIIPNVLKNANNTWGNEPENTNVNFGLRDST